MWVRPYVPVLVPGLRVSSSGPSIAFPSRSRKYLFNSPLVVSFSSFTWAPPLRLGSVVYSDPCPTRFGRLFVAYGGGTGCDCVWETPCVVPSSPPLSSVEWKGTSLKPEGVR